MSLLRAFVDSAHGSQDGTACPWLIFPFSLATQTKLFLSVPADFLLIRMLRAQGNKLFPIMVIARSKAGVAVIKRALLPSELGGEGSFITAGTLCL